MSILRRSFLRHGWWPLALLATSCSQASSTPAPSAAAMTAAASATPAAAPTAKASDEPAPSPVPREPFTDPKKNFEAAKQALLEGYYRDSLTEEDLYRAAVAGMVEQADPAMHKWNKLLSPFEVASLRSDLQGELVGIGVSIDMDPATGYIDVKGTFPGTPADRAGIAPPDKIVTIDGKLYKGMSLHDAVRDIRGKAGQPIALTILRGAQLVNVSVTREAFSYDTVQHLMLADDIGYVRIPAFNEHTPDALRGALTDVVGHHARALVLDVRCDPGGSFDASVAAVSEMVPAGSTVVSLHKRTHVEAVTSKGARVLPDMPIAILADHDTASSAELLSAALKELVHATIVGSQTQGKWTVQTLTDLPNGYALKYTIAVFASPNDKSYEGVGLTPDVEVDMSDEAIQRARTVTDVSKRLAEDVQLRTAVTLLTHGK